MHASQTNYLSAALLAATTLVVAACSSGDSDRPMPAPPAANTAPYLTEQANRSADQDTVLALNVGVDDFESGASMVTVSVTADSNAVFPADGIRLSGSAGARTLTLTPLEAATGSTLITLVARDPKGAATTRAFTVMVNARRVSVRTAALDTFAKAEDADPTVVNGLTFDQDADDSAAFDALIPAQEE